MSAAKREPEYDFGPYDDEYRGFDIRDDDTGRGPLILVLALGVLLIFAGVVWNTYRQGVRPTEGGLPVIASDDAPYKRAPEERGGVEVAGQDKAYYDSMDGLGDPALQKTAARNPIDIRRRDPALAGGPTELVPPEAAASDAESETPRIVYAESDRAQIRVEEAPAVTIASVQSTREPVGAASLSEIAATSRFADYGTYQVQLSALRSEDAAKSAWGRMQSSAPDLFQGARLDIQRADLGARGVFYRLRIGTFENREAASGFCADVKAAGKDCMVVAKATG